MAVFASTPLLNEFWLYLSRNIAHRTCQTAKRGGGDGRRKQSGCVLCTIGKDRKGTTFYCDTFKVPLCVTSNGSGRGATCFQLWHSRQDLHRTNGECHRRYLLSKNAHFGKTAKGLEHIGILKHGTRPQL